MFFRLFWKRGVRSKEFVNLSVGKVYLYEVTNKMVNEATNKATINKYIHTNKFLQEMEYALLDLPKRRINNLSIKDGNIIREKVKEVLIGLDVLEVEKRAAPTSDEANIFDDKDIEWFQRTATSSINRLRGGEKSGHGRNH